MKCESVLLCCVLLCVFAEDLKVEVDKAGKILSKSQDLDIEIKNVPQKERPMKDDEYHRSTVENLARKKNNYEKQQKILQQGKITVVSEKIANNDTDKYERSQNMIEKVLKSKNKVVIVEGLARMPQIETKVAQSMYPKSTGENLFGMENFFLHEFAEMVSIWLRGPLSEGAPWDDQKQELIWSFTNKERAPSYYWSKLATAPNHLDIAPLYESINDFLSENSDRKQGEESPLFEGEHASDTDQWAALMISLVKEMLADATQTVEEFPAAIVEKWIKEFNYKKKNAALEFWMASHELFEVDLKNLISSRVVAQVLQEFSKKKKTQFFIILSPVHLEGVLKELEAMSSTETSTLKLPVKKWEQLDEDEFYCDFFKTKEYCEQIEEEKEEKDEL